jgi:hypothetical protein
VSAITGTWRPSLDTSFRFLLFLLVEAEDVTAVVRAAVQAHLVGGFEVATLRAVHELRDYEAIMATALAAARGAHLLLG